MIETLRIQNFKSIKDATVNLKDVNLIIGPNNSGKSNFFAALEFLKNWFEKGEVPEDLERYYFKKKFPDLTKYPVGFDKLPAFTFIKQLSDKEFFTYRIEFAMGGKYPLVCEFQGIAKEIFDFYLNDIKFINQNFEKYSSIYGNRVFYKNPFFNEKKENLNHQKITFWNKSTANGHSLNFEYLGTHTILERNTDYKDDFLENIIFNFQTDFASYLYNQVKNQKIYSIDINTLKKPFPTLANEMQVSEDASNLVAFLDNMDDQNPEVIRKIEKDLKFCVPEFKGLRFLKVRISEEADLFKIYGNQTYKKIGLSDKFGQTYWADELSEGTLYFLALLAIIHQPNPPKLLLLEEPEKGIHPRRISEIMDFIFELAELKGMQVIISTHSTQVVDEFREMPEHIFVFDKPKDETIIRNLQTDILDVDNQKLAEKGIPPIELNGSLGEHWANGILGGIPAETH